MQVHTCLHIYTSKHMHHMFRNTHTHIHICAQLIQVYAPMYPHTSMHICTHIHVHTYIQVLAHPYVYACIHIYTQSCIQFFICGGHSSLCHPGLPGTHSIFQADLQLTALLLLCPPDTEIAGMRHHACLKLSISWFSSFL